LLLLLFDVLSALWQLAKNECKFVIFDCPYTECSLVFTWFPYFFIPT
jgi:hypothetical protein